jgi:hypothetical protein
MSTPNITKVPFAPYQLEQNDRNELVVKGELTLREVVLHNYIRGAATWLLGYQGNISLADQLQARNMPLRAQQMEGPYQTAWSILLLLESADLLGQSYPELRQEIHRKILGAVTWLIDKGQEFAAKDEKQRTNWEDWYDTAVITYSLLRANDAGLLSDSSQESSLLAIKQASSWLGDITFRQLTPPYQITQRVIDDLALHGGESLASMLSIMFYTRKVAQVDLIEIFCRRQGKLHPAVLSLLDNTTAFVKQAFESPVSSEVKHLYLPIHFDILMALADILIENHTQSLKLSVQKVSAIRSLLIQGIETLESMVLEEDFQIETSNRLDRLTTYIRSSKALSIKDTEDKAESFGRSDLILGQLRSIVNAIDPFENGSTFHDLHATWHTLRCFLEVYSWPSSNRKIIDLYDDQLKASLRAFDVRKQFYQLQQRLIDTEQQLATQQQELERSQWLRQVLFAILIFILIAEGLLVFFGDLNMRFDLNVVGIIVTCATLVGSVGYAINRFLTRHEQ